MNTTTDETKYTPAAEAKTAAGTAAAPASGSTAAADGALSVSERLELAITEIRRQLPGLEILEQEPMSLHCSFRTGGPVRAFAAPDSVTSFAKVLSILKDRRLAPYILGNGTNVVFPDEGESCLFVLSTEKLQRLFLLPDGSVYAEAGVSLAHLASFALEQELAGLEFASGIPGTVGGGAVMNAGAYGGELKDVLQSVVLYYLQDQSLYEMTADQCAFGYRSSYFQKTPGCVILSAVFSLRQGSREEIAGKMKELNARRREKQPLELPSAGSAFRRPEGHYAAALIEECGLKGYRIGGAQVSEKHAGFIVNTGNATSKDLYDLLVHVRNTVYREKGIPLEPEIILLSPGYVLEDNGPRLRRNTVFSDAPASRTDAPDTEKEP